MILRKKNIDKVRVTRKKKMKRQVTPSCQLELSKKVNAFRVTDKKQHDNVTILEITKTIKKDPPKKQKTKKKKTPEK